MSNQQPIRAAGLGVRTRQATLEQTIRSGEEDAIKKSDKHLLDLVKELHKGLSEEVYDEETVKVIKLTRVILDLPSIDLELKKPICNVIFPKFHNAVFF